MANVSFSKVFFGLIYLAIPLFLILCPDVVSPYLTEDWMIPAIIGAMAFFGLLFAVSQKKNLISALALVLVFAGAGYVVYSNWDSYMDRFKQVDADYELKSGTYYDTDKTAFQSKVGQVSVLAEESLPDLARVEWIAMIIPLLVLGAMGMKGVLEFAAIPSSHTKNVYDAKDIPEDIEAQTNRPSAEQRAAKLAAIKSAAPEKKEQSIQNSMAPDDQPLVAPISPAFTTTAPKSGVIMPSWENASAEAPVIKTPTVETESSTASPFQFEMPAQAPKSEAVVVPEPVKVPEAVVVPEPIKVPETVVVPEPVSVPEPVKVPEVVVTPPEVVYPEVVAAPEPVKAPEPVVVPEPVKEPEVVATPPEVVYPEVAVASEPVKEPEAVITPEPVKEPEVTANPFENMASPFGKVNLSAPVAPAQAEAPAEAANPFANMASPFSAPAKEEAPVYTKVRLDIPVETAKSVIKPASPSTQSAVTSMVPQAKTRPSTTKDQISDDDKARIKDLQKQVAELKTLYNQGMITQDEYITQRTNLLQQMYSK